MLRANKILIIICVFIILCLIILRLLFVQKNNRNNQVDTTQTLEKISNEDLNTIEDIKKEVDATADTSMYKVEEEYDGRKIIQIRPDIQFDTVLAGILKNSMPKESEIQSLLQNRPTKNGIWISKQSRDVFLKILERNDIKSYLIDDEGYLYKSSENNKQKLDQAINSDKLYIIDISGTCYTRDELSGEIVEYPFEEMEPEQILEIYSVENSTILEITKNSNGKISNKEILEEILANLD